MTKQEHTHTHRFNLDQVSKGMGRRSGNLAWGDRSHTCSVETSASCPVSRAGKAEAFLTCEAGLQPAIPAAPTPCGKEQAFPFQGRIRGFLGRVEGPPYSHSVCSLYQAPVGDQAVCQTLSMPSPEFPSNPMTVCTIPIFQMKKPRL